MNNARLETIPANLIRSLPLPPPVALERGLSPAQWGMISFLVSEVALFSTLIVVYLTFRGSDLSGPTPAILSRTLVFCTTFCLIASSVTIHFAVKSLSCGERSAFLRWWTASILLGLVFLAGTAYEWRELIVIHDLTIGRNLFGSTYYTLVGFHALHVTAGVVLMLTVLGLTLNRLVSFSNRAGVALVSWYWHFVDCVWLVVFAVVYLA
ncbi:MAG: cytochrome c oxidase, subunit [Planctomycetaceae bacterium]|nr:cytochrome c oxidase, subunit [Planctomycetaceae bacterium]